MSNEQPLLDCTFGWGKTCRLYLDSIEIADKSYKLDDLTSIHPSYRCVLGIPSARLELSFGQHRLILRGIADLDVARQIVSHLRIYCDDESLLTHSHSRSSRARNLARAQARAWERTSKLPAIPASAEDAPAVKGASDSLDDLSSPQPPAPPEPLEVPEPEPVHDETPPLAEATSQEAPRKPADTSLTPGEMLAAFAQLARGLTTSAEAWPLARLQALRAPRYQPPLHSVRLVDPAHKTFDTNSMPVPAIKSNVLPIIHVPVRLQPGECAHYSIGASLCSDRLSGSERAPYPPLDHGLLILTNRRIFYIGKRSQLILAYTRLWYVSLLHTAIALHIEGQFRRIIIELEHPHEWASRVEQLAFIARRERPRSELPTLAVSALPGLPANAITLKRPALKVSTPPLLAEQISSKIVDANTISLDEPPELACADLKTQDFPVSTAEAGLPEITELPTLVDALLPEVSQRSALENAPTREFSLQSDLASMKTPEIPLQPELEEMSSQDLAEEKATQDLSYVESGPLEQDARDDGRCVETSALCDPGLKAENSAEIDTLSLCGFASQADEDSQTLPIRLRKLSQARTISLKEPVSDRLPDVGIIPRRIARRRVPYRPFYAREGRPE